MNTYKKYCPNVFVAKCEEKHEKGDVIIVETKHGKKNECIVHNFIGYTGTKEKPFYCYSITRADGYNSQERARQKSEKVQGWISSANKKSHEYYVRSNKDSDFLRLGEPIKVGHHSERKHRRIIEQAQNNASKCVEFAKKAESYESKQQYWEEMADKIDLSMPESLEFFKNKLSKAEKQHLAYKTGVIEQEHAYSIAYAKKAVNEAKKNLELAIKLWG